MTNTLPKLQFTPPARGATRSVSRVEICVMVFQSTPPVWGATVGKLGRLWAWAFQSTPPVWGGDYRRSSRSRRPPHFNPRPPCGGRPSVQWYCTSLARFQSTPPVWGATFSDVADSIPQSFQSTPPVWGATHSPPLTTTPF